MKAKKAPTGPITDDTAKEMTALVRFIIGGVEDYVQLANLPASVCIFILTRALVCEALALGGNAEGIKNGIDDMVIMLAARKGVTT